MSLSTLGASLLGLSSSIVSSPFAPFALWGNSLHHKFTLHYSTLLNYETGTRLMPVMDKSLKLGGNNSAGGSVCATLI